MMRFAPWVLAVILCGCGSKSSPPMEVKMAPANPAPATPGTNQPVPPQEAEVTRLYMHNVDLHETPTLRLRVRWLRATLQAAHPGMIPSFDDSSSFILNIQNGVVGVSLKDLATALNVSVLKNTALRDVKLSQAGNQLRLNGTLHKIVPLPVETLSDLSAAPDGRIHIHLAKLRVLKIPMKGLLKAFDIKTADVIDPKGDAGIEVKGDDIYIDPEKVLPNPRKRGRITNVTLRNGEVIETYGAATADILKRQEWRNYIAVFGGSLEFGKLTMRHADVVMIDLSDDQWFEFDIARYQEQLVFGYMKTTANAGLRVFMPDIDSIPHNKANKSISLEWMKNRNLPFPDPMEP